VLVWRLDAADGAPDPYAPAGWTQQIGEPIATVFNYACHMTSQTNVVRSISTDYAGVARQVVERLVGGLALFVQGAAGNINPVLRGPNWTNMQRMGHTLGAEAARLALTAAPVASVPIRVAREVVDFPAMLPRSVEEARRRLGEVEEELARLAEQSPNPGRQRYAETRRERWARGLAALEGGPPLPPVRGELCALRVGDVALAGNPSELFCEIGLAIKRQSPIALTGVAGYTDGPMIGYVPTRAAYPEGGYEVDRACRVNPEAGELLEETSVRLLRSLA
jgi:hypothetical protein